MSVYSLIYAIAPTVMNTIETQFTQQNAESLWAAIEQHLGNTSPYDVLGVAKGAPEHAVRGAYMAKKTKLIKLADTPQRQAAMEQVDIAHKVITGNVESLVYQQWEQYKAHTSHNAEVKQMPLSEQAIERLEAVAAASKRFALNKPLVAVGASIAVIGSIALAIKASEHIRESKDNGETPARADRAAQALGLAGAVGVISAAALMWKNAASQARG